MPASVIVLVLISAIMHAGWNALASQQRAADFFMRISIVIVGIGLTPSLAAEYFDAPILGAVWTYAVFGGISLAIYYFALAHGYRSGGFSMVYPLARALPVLLIALSDLARGHPPSLAGWFGIILVSAGCILIPLESLHGISHAHYWNRTSAWILISACGIVGYTVADSVAAQAAQLGPFVAMRYNVYESTVALFVLAGLLKFQRQPLLSENGWNGWRVAAIAALFLFGAYSLILWAYQLTPYASYITALRQVSIVIGVSVGAFAFREPAPFLRISAALIIVLGVALIVLT